MQLDKSNIASLLDSQLKRYQTSDFIAADPVCIPHLFTKKQDIEIASFFAASLAWGQRKTIINNCTKLMQLMDNAPHQFVLNHTIKDLEKFKGFVHRTFLLDDLLYFIEWLKHHYSLHSSLESAFLPKEKNLINTEQHLITFYNNFFSLEHLPRTHKHVASPAKASACKRLNMFLRWMVRKDKYGIDFNLWHNIKPHQLVMPLDVHVTRVAHQLGLIKSNKANWQTAVELTNTLKHFNAADPVIYDYALFSLGEDGRL
jgi:uncharacterized protein (TIGR02757 family)